MHPKISSLTPPMIFLILKNRNICESPIHQEASNKISSKSNEKQRSYSNFSNGMKIANFSEMFALRTPNFRLFSAFYSDSERNRMRGIEWRLSYRNLSVSSRDLTGGGRIGPPAPVNVLQKAHQ